MFASIVRKLNGRLGVPGIIAILALILAMAGGAWAKGGFVITKLNQIKPSVQAQLKGKAGPQGAVGPAGKDGTNGANGANGKDGSNGSNGKDGANGKEGSPWTLGGTLPSEKTLTGAWAFGNTTAAGEIFVPISFSLPLSESLAVDQVHFINEAGKEVVLIPPATIEEVENPPDCQGSAAEPSAEPGNLCIYTGFDGAVAFLAVSNFSILQAGGNAPGADVTGARLTIEASGPGAGGNGTWAVTAE